MLPKASTYVKVIMDKLNGCIFVIKEDELFEKYNTIWHKANDKNLIVNLCITKSF